MRRIGVGTRVAYGLGAMAFAAKDAAFVNFVPFFYTQVVGLSGTLYGLAAFAGQLSDALTDPIFGTLSDNHRSRWGRRHPFMAASAIPLALCFLLLFHPPDLPAWGTCLWLAAVAVALRTFLTAFAIPHAALGAELSSDYEERSLIVSYRTALGWVAGVVLPFVALTWIFTADGSGSDGRLVAGNYDAYAWLSAGLALTAIAVTVWFTRGEIAHLPPAGPQRRLAWLDPLRDVAEALRNRNFRFIFLSLLSSGAATGVSVTLGFYANTYFWEFSTRQIGAITLFSLVPTLTSFALLRPLVQRFDKKSIFLGAVALLILNALWWIPGRLLGLLPENGDPLLFRLAFVQQFFLVTAVVLVQVALPSMIADVADEHEWQRGERKDGVFFAALGFGLKVPTGLGQLLGGVIIDLVALPTRAQPGSVAPEVLLHFGLAAGPLVALSFLVPIALILPYRLTRRRHAELQVKLAERRAAVS